MEAFWSWSRCDYEGRPESIQPFWVSRELVAWPWCNLAASRGDLTVHPWIVTVLWG